MNNPDRRNASPPDAAPDLVADFRRRREALETEARELAKLHADVMSAAERDGAAIVVNARAQIARVMADARRELQNLATRVQSIAALEGEDVLPLFRDSKAARASLQQARREIAQVLEDTKPELEQIRREVVVPKPGAERPEAPSLPPVPAPLPRVAAPDPPLPAPLRREAAADPTVALPIPRAPALVPPAAAPQPPAPAPDWPPIPWDFTTPGPERRTFGWPPDFRQLRVKIAAIAIAALATILGGLWVVRQSAKRGAEPPAQSAPAQPGASNTSGVTDPRKPLAQGRLTLVVEARRPVWIRMTIDGRSEGGLFQSGQRSQFAADSEIELRAGDAGAVSVSTNGGAAQVLGRDGEVATRRFTPDGLEGTAEPTSGAPVAGPPPVTPPPLRASGDSSAPAAAPPATSNRPNPAMELTTNAQRWLDAYHRQDAATMQAVATRDMKRSDQRSAGERLPPGAEDVRRTLENVSFQFVGETAILSAKMIEQGSVSGQGAQRISWVSLMWIRESSRWLLADVQILSDAKLRSR